jgi:hypothetical protein
VREDVGYEVGNPRVALRKKGEIVKHMLLIVGIADLANDEIFEKTRRFIAGVSRHHLVLLGFRCHRRSPTQTYHYCRLQIPDWSDILLMTA